MNRNNTLIPTEIVLGELHLTYETDENQQMK